MLRLSPKNQSFNKNFVTPFVVPADIISGLGQGDTSAGYKVLTHMFGQQAPRHHAPTGKVPIMAAGGEYVIPTNMVAVIGGGDIYALALPQAQRVLRTRVHAKVVGDAYFPALSADDWQLVASEDFAADARHAYAMTFETLERRPAR